MSFPQLKEFVYSNTYVAPPPIEMPLAGADGLRRIAAMLDQNKAKVIDLFRQWDSSDANGLISRGEFKHAMRRLGLNPSADEVVALFGKFDKVRVDRTP